MIFGVRWQSKLEMQLHAILGKMIAANACIGSINYMAGGIDQACSG
jgi:hypothetical protein